jgi:class 3 adenylate cyclase/tetratricopeptide (TPR) repeat protein
MRCHNCEFDSQPDAAFCAQCGSALLWACLACSHGNDATAKFCTACGRARESVNDDTQPAIPPRAPELRQITFVFCDLVNSTALSESIDPEGYSDLIIEYREIVADRVQKHGGTIGRFIGDGLLIYFGYPQAAENDAARAVQAALEIAARMPELRLPSSASTLEQPGIRIGIHTGIAVVGNLGGSGALEEDAAIGRATNIAARAQEFAKTGQVILTRSTYQLVAPHFEVRSLGTPVLKGLSEAIEMLQVVGATRSSPDFRRPLRYRSKLCGRDQEVAILSTRWQRASERKGSAILISGEAGIGKSRLVRDFMEEKAALKNASVRLVECLEQTKGTAFHPFREMLRNALEIPPQIDAEALEARLQEEPSVRPDEVSALTHFLLEPIANSQPTPTVTPEKLRHQIIEAVVEWLAAQQADKPLLLVVEDLHWSDDSSLLLLERIMANLEASRVLLLLTVREEFQKPLLHNPLLNRLHLERLDAVDARTMVQALAGAQPVPAEVVDLMLHRTDCMPLYLEELMLVWLERREHEAGKTLIEAEVPSTLRDAFTERLDRLGASKDMALFAAILGQTFSIEILQACLEISDEQMTRDLQALTHASIVRRRGTSGSLEFEFRHALVRQVAHDSLLSGRRRGFHSRIVEVLRAQFSELCLQRPGTLAFHLEEAGRIAEAITAWTEAGRHSASQSANVEALGYLKRGLRLLDAGGQDLAKRLDLLLAMGGPLIAIHGWADDKVDELYKESIDICELIADDRKFFDVLRGHQNVLLLRGELARCRAISEQLLDMAKSLESNDATLFLEAWRGLGVCSFLAGDFEAAIEELDCALSYYLPDKHDRNAAIYGSNPGVVAQCWRAWANWFCGDLEQATAGIEGAIALARTARHPFSENYALCFAASIFQSDGQADIALRYADEALSLAEEKGFPYWSAWGGIVKGWAEGVVGNAPAGRARLADALGSYEATGARMIVGYANALAADIAIREGDIAGADGYLKTAEMSARDTGMTFFLGFVAAEREQLDHVYRS